MVLFLLLLVINVQTAKFYFKTFAIRNLSNVSKPIILNIFSQCVYDEQRQHFGGT